TNNPLHTRKKTINSAALAGTTQPDHTTTTTYNTQAAASADHTPPHAHPQKEHTHSNAKQTKNASSTLLSSQTPHAQPHAP
ncbi:hypothetical protein, partial [Corynebacterium heidelbergense]|uniref:hypothetical protein n=1 Tax=Corynebacterium heidelbergense TaxID=2055947 RepID=UPI001EE77FAE